MVLLTRGHVPGDEATRRWNKTEEGCEVVDLCSRSGVPVAFALLRGGCGGSRPFFRCSCSEMAPLSPWAATHTASSGTERGILALLGALRGWRATFILASVWRCGSQRCALRTPSAQSVDSVFAIALTAAVPLTRLALATAARPPAARQRAAVARAPRWGSVAPLAPPCLQSWHGHSLHTDWWQEPWQRERSKLRPRVACWRGFPAPAVTSAADGVARISSVSSRPPQRRYGWGAAARRAAAPVDTMPRRGRERAPSSTRVRCAPSRGTCV